MKHRSVAEFGISQPVLRREDRRFVTGAGRYTNDIDLAGQLHAAFARSNYAHAELRRVHTAEAEAMAGVVAVFTGGLAISRALDDQNVGDRMKDLAAAPVPSNRRSPEYLRKYLGDEITKWATIMKELNVERLHR